MTPFISTANPAMEFFPLAIIARELEQVHDPSLILFYRATGTVWCFVGVFLAVPAIGRPTISLFSGVIRFLETATASVQVAKHFKTTHVLKLCDASKSK